MKKKQQNHFMNYNVGQGGFYIGMIDEEGDKPFIFIYDCGTNSKKMFLQEAIGKANNRFMLKNKNVIDILVLSHFDADHINGVSDLLKTNTVKKLFIPFFHPDALFLFKASFLLNNVPKNQIENTYFIPENDETNNLDNNTELDDIEEPVERAEVIKGDDELFGKVSKISRANFKLKKFWKFKFKEYNDPNQKINSRFVKIIKICIDDIENGKSVAHNMSQLKYIFKKNFVSAKQRNNISLMLFHEPISEVTDNYKIQEQIYNKSNVYSAAVKNSKNFATVLTGDTSFKSKKQYEQFKNWAGTKLYLLDLPHHGAINNIPSNIGFWNEYPLKEMTLISNSRINNKYHPDKIIRKKAHETSKSYIECNEYYGFGYYIRKY